MGLPSKDGASRALCASLGRLLSGRGVAVLTILLGSSVWMSGSRVSSRMSVVAGRCLVRH